jgi:hypothetical protein
MVVFERDIARIAILEPEGETPIRPHQNSPLALAVAFELMETKARTIESFNRQGALKRRQKDCDPLDHVGRQFAAIIILVKPLQASVPKAPDH